MSLLNLEILLSLIAAFLAGFMLSWTLGGRTGKQ